VGIAVAVPAALLLAACGSSSSASSTTVPADAHVGVQHNDHAACQHGQL